MDVDTFFDCIRQNLIDLISKELLGLTDLGSARVQPNTWINFRTENEEGIIDSVRLPLVVQ